MSWLRVDDAFSTHPKLLLLPRPDRWTWMELLCFCARYRTNGTIPPQIREAVPAATPQILEKLVCAGLLDQDDDGNLSIHDWRDYNPKDPTAADRMRRSRERDRNNDRNGDRNGTVTATVTNGVTETYRDRDSRAGSRARPVPSPTPTTPAAAQTAANDDAAAANKHHLETAGWTPTQISTATTTDPDLARAARLLEESQADPTATNPAALAWTKHQAGHTTTKPTDPKAERDTRRTKATHEAEQFAKTYHGDSDTFANELDRIERDHRTTIPTITRERLWDLTLGEPTNHPPNALA